MLACEHDHRQWSYDEGRLLVRMGTLSDRVVLITGNTASAASTSGAPKLMLPSQPIAYLCAKNARGPPSAA